MAASEDRHAVKVVKEKVAEAVDRGCEIYTCWGPPGTGKTHEAIGRFGDIRASGGRPVMITFSRAAREDMFLRSRLARDLAAREKGGRNFRTVDSICYKLAISAIEAEIGENPGESKDWSIYDIDKSAFLDEAETPLRNQVDDFDAIAEQRTLNKFEKWLRGSESAEAAASEFGVQSVSSLFTLSDNPAKPGANWKFLKRRRANLRLDEPVDEAVAALQDIWMRFCVENKVLLFDDIRWMNATRLNWSGTEWAHTTSLIIDEAQDLSPLQVYIALRWAESSKVKDIHVIGDPNQSIMGFQGAESALFTDVFLPASIQQKRNKFLSLTQRFGMHNTAAAERYRKEELGKHWEQGAGQVTAKREGGTFVKEQWGSPADIVNWASDGAMGGDSVFILLTNRWGAWSGILSSLCSKGVPYRTAAGNTGDGRQGIFGIPWRTEQQRKKGISERTLRWRFSSPSVAVLGLMNGSGKEGHVRDTQLKALDILTEDLMKEGWEEEWKQYRKRHGHTAEIPAADAEAWYSPHAKQYAPSLSHLMAYPEVELLDIVERFASPIDTSSLPSSEKGKPYHKMLQTHSQFGSLCWSTHYEYAGKAESSGGCITLATVHQSKGRECDVAYFVPTGPPETYHRRWEVGMLKTYYVAITRARRATVIMEPVGSPYGWGNTQDSQAWKALERTLAYAAGRDGENDG